MELKLPENFLHDEDQLSHRSSKPTCSLQIQRKHDKTFDEKTVSEKSINEVTTDNLTSILMKNYDSKLFGEDDTSQPTSRAAPIIPIETTRKKKKRKRSQISICLTNCRYESIRKVASAFGMREVSEEDAWNFYWTDMSVSVERAKEMKRFQRINHFPGMLEICRKDLLARNLNRMQKIYPKEYNFFPKTWCLPADFGEALNYSKSRKNKTFIIKPECGSQGRGIYLTKSLKDIKPTDKLICQVNHSPSFHTDTQLDREVKESLLTDTFTMLNIWQCDKKRVLEEDRKRIRDRLLQTNKFAEYTPTEEREPEKSPWQTQIQWEETHLGNFRRVYPVGEQYAALFQQPSGSLYAGTASSRARGDCTRIQREEFLQTKAKAEALKKPSQPQPKPLKDGEKNAPDESSVCAPASAATSSADKTSKSKPRFDKDQKRKEKDEKDKTKLTVKTSLTKNTASEKESKPPYVVSSFEPDPIVEKEERERVNLLAQRDFLIRSYGMLEQIYLVMKKMGTLRPEDERKYGVYGRLSMVSNSPKIM